MGKAGLARLSLCIFSRSVPSKRPPPGSPQAHAICSVLPLDWCMGRQGAYFRTGRRGDISIIIKIKSWE